MINHHRMINRGCYAVTAWLLVGCNAPPPATMADAAAPDDGMSQALNMRLVGRTTCRRGPPISRSCTPMTTDAFSSSATILANP